MSAPVLPTPLAACLTLAAKDLCVERRTGETLLVIGPFGAVALLLAPMAVGVDTPLLAELGPALYWLVVLLFGVLVTLRSSAVDEPAQRAMLALTGVSPRVLLAGRALGNGVLLLAFELLIAPAAVLLYNPDLTGWPWLLPVLVLVATGIAVLGALVDALAVGLAGRTTLGPLLIAPIGVPLLLGATGVARSVGYGVAPWPWLLLLATVDLVVVLLAVWCTHHLEDST